MPYPIPIQVHVIWHPDSEDFCFPLAKKLYIALNRDSYQPLVPGIGIPVFFRCAGANPARPNDVPASIAVPDTEYDLRIALAAPRLLLDQAWCRYVADNFTEVADMRDRATLLVFGKPIPNSAVKAVVMDLKHQRAGEHILQHVLLQACRLIAQRLPREGAGNLGAAPLKLFLSHTKRDKVGLKVAQAVKKYLDGMAVDRFFDEVSIQPGDDIGSELKRSIADSALVAIRTDGYMASPWCRREVALAKQARRPMAVLDALIDKEARSSPFLANLPSIRIGVDTIDDVAQLERVANFIGLEVLRFLHAERQLRLLQQQNLVAAHAILLPRQPEPRDLAALLGASVASRTFVHPDPVLSAEESEEYTAYQATFMTPTSVWSKKLTGLQFGMSVSLGDPKEERALGLSSPLHLEDATRIVARQALAAGATLVYGGALSMKPGQPGQLTEALFEMIGAYNKSGQINAPPLINYAAWPWSEEVDEEWLASRLEMLTVKVWPRPEDLADPDVEPGPGKFLRLAKTPQGGYVLSRSLSAMRAELTARTHARVVLGGKPHSFMGIMPGVIEEALFAIRRRQPLYVIGGFGGAAGLLGQAMLGQHPESLTLDFQQAKSPAYAEVVKVYERERTSRPALNLPAVDYPALVQELDAYGLAGLSATNGLSEQENRELLATGSIDSALFLLMKGLSSISPNPR
jgi:hypothetical protein